MSALQRLSAITSHLQPQQQQQQQQQINAVSTAAMNNSDQVTSESAIPKPIADKKKTSYEEAFPLKDKYVVHSSRNDLPNMHKAKVIVISCVDFRLRDEMTALLNNEMKLEDNYDEFVIPGASLALTYTDRGHWAQTTIDVIGIMKSLHDLERVIFVDHKSCGAYKLVLGEGCQADEKACHYAEMVKARDIIIRCFPHLQVHGFLLDIQPDANGNLTAENLRIEIVPQQPHYQHSREYSKFQ